MDYTNGHIPDDRLITFNEGWDPGEGHWKWQLSPATYQKHLRLVALAKARTGGDLRLSDGWSGYRPYQAQVYARELYGTGAAVVGTSSHGGIWFDGPRGQRIALAIDYGNWGQVYGWDRAAFYEDVRAAGLEPGLIHPSRGNGYPDEPWHVIDLDPWAEPTPTLDESEEDEDMPDSMFAVVDGVPSWCWLNWATGTLYAVHTQAEADWVGAYMGSVKMNLSQRSYNGSPVTDGGTALYKSKLALFGILCPDVKVKGSSLTPTDLARIQAMLRAGTAATVA